MCTGGDPSGLGVSYLARPPKQLRVAAQGRARLLPSRGATGGRRLGGSLALPSRRGTEARGWESHHPESNREPPVYKTGALPIELWWRGRLRSGGVLSCKRGNPLTRHKNPLTLALSP